MSEEVRPAPGSGAPTTVDYLTGTADGTLSAEIVVGTTPGGELGGTWASPTVDSVHSGTAHSDATSHSHAAGDSSKASASADYTPTTTTATDITGATLSLAANTYIVVGAFDVTVNSALNDRLFEGVLDVGGVDENDLAVLNAPGLVNVRAPLVQAWRVVLGSTTTVKLQARHSGGTAGDFTVNAANTTITAFTTGPGNLAGQELDYAERTTNLSVTATSEATADTIVTGAAVAYDGATTVMIDFSADSIEPSAGAGRYIAVVLYDGASSIGELFVARQGSTGTHDFPVYGRRRLTPSAATHTYSARAWVSTGTGLVSAGTGGSATAAPALLRITRV